MREPLERMAREREEMLESLPTCQVADCEAKVVESEVCAYVQLPKYPEAPRPAAYLERCEVGHEYVIAIKEDR